jgi:putative membrane protein
MRKHIFLLSLSLMLAAGCGQQRGNEPSTANNTSSQSDTQAKTGLGTQISSSDQQFVQEAASGGMKEVELSEFVAGKTKNAEVKQLAERIAQDHTTANSELKTAAQQDSGEMPAAMDEKAIQEVNQFKNMSGERLDRAYVEHMIEDHKKDITKFQQQANSGAAPQVKAFAQKTLPTLQEHLRMAQQVQDKLGRGQSKTGTD